MPVTEQTYCAMLLYKTSVYHRKLRHVRLHGFHNNLPVLKYRSHTHTHLEQCSITRKEVNLWLLPRMGFQRQWELTLAVPCHKQCIATRAPSCVCAIYTTDSLIDSIISCNADLTRICTNSELCIIYRLYEFKCNCSSYGLISYCSLFVWCVEEEVEEHFVDKWVFNDSFSVQEKTSRFDRITQMLIDWKAKYLTIKNDSEIECWI